MSSRALLVLLAAAGILASATANAASFSPNLSLRSPGATNTSTLAGPSGYGGYGTPKGPPPLPRSGANDPYDTSSNLNPGGDGSGFKPGNKPKSEIATPTVYLSPLAGLLFDQSLSIGGMSPSRTVAQFALTSTPPMPAVGRLVDRKEASLKPDWPQSLRSEDSSWLPNSQLVIRSIKHSAIMPGGQSSQS